MTVQTTRRGFLGATAATALVIGVRPDGAFAASQSGEAADPFVRISASGDVTVILKHFEMGQGTTTGLTTLVAEELGADWSRVGIEFAPSDNETYKNLAFGSQGTGGSTAIANSFIQYRSAGAACRAVLLEAAASAWGVDAATLDIVGSEVTDGTKAVSIGEFADAASKLTPPAEPTLKDPADFVLIGDAKLPRKDTPAKINGTAEFATDVKIPGMVLAAILRTPRFGGTLISFDASAAAEVPGYVDAKALPNGAGVAVFAQNTWAAFQARDAITAEWDFSKAENRSSDQMFTDALAQVAAEPEYQTREISTQTAKAAVDSAATVLDAEFIFPNLAHAPMEPLTCTIEPLAGGGVMVHDGCQFPSITQPTVAYVLGLDAAQVEVRTVYAGGSFGRRAIPASDYHVEAAMAFALLGGKTPVKLAWSREDDLAGGFYRPLFAHNARIGLDGDGKIAGWEHRTATQSIFKGTALESFVVHNGVDHASVEGIADTPYDIANMGVGLSDFVSPMTVLWWRSVGHSQSGYVMESLVDMAAEAAGADPLSYRLAMLGSDSPDHVRMRGVLELVAEKAGWSEPMPKGRGRGLAVHKSFNSYVAQVVEVTDVDGAIKIDRVVCAVDCGVAINPDVVKAQMEGGIGYGIGAVMRNTITFTDGEVDQQNFPDYEPLRIADIGAIEVHIMPSTEAPTGVGEPGLPPAGPALANAIAAATGKRITKLPMAENGVEFV